MQQQPPPHAAQAAPAPKFDEVHTQVIPRKVLKLFGVWQFMPNCAPYRPMLPTGATYTLRAPDGAPVEVGGSVTASAPGRSGRTDVQFLLQPPNNIPRVTPPAGLGGIVSQNGGY